MQDRNTDIPSIELARHRRELKEAKAYEEDELSYEQRKRIELIRRLVATW